jgi:hypothetical protein
VRKELCKISKVVVKGPGNHCIRYETESTKDGNPTIASFVTSSLLPSHAISWLEKLGPLKFSNLDSDPLIYKTPDSDRSGAKKPVSLMERKKTVVVPEEKKLLCRRSASPGQVLARENPVILLPAAMLTGGAEMDVGAVFDNLRDRVSDIVEDPAGKAGSPRARLMKLSNSHPRSFSMLEGIIRTNGLSLTLSSQENISGVFIRIARCNHS